jgi:hypothetical protein
MVRHACDEFNDVSSAMNCAQNILVTAMTLRIRMLLLNIPAQSAANSFKTIMYTAMRIPINTFSSSNTLLLDVVTLLSLQFLLALSGDVHPNPGPCKSKKTKRNNQNTNAENYIVNTKGESVKILGTSINLINWNA